MSFLARNEKLGKEALDELRKELGSNGDKIRFHQLDITDKSSAEKLRDHLKKEHDGFDIFVNNAGFAFKVRGTYFRNHVLLFPNGKS